MAGPASGLLIHVAMDNAGKRGLGRNLLVQDAYDVCSRSGRAGNSHRVGTKFRNLDYGTDKRLLKATLYFPGPENIYSPKRCVNVGFDIIR